MRPSLRGWQWTRHTAGISSVPLPNNSGLSLTSFLTCFRLRESSVQHQNEKTVLLFSERLAHLSREWENVEFLSLCQGWAVTVVWSQSWWELIVWLEGRIPLGRYSALQRSLGQAGCSREQEGMGNYARHGRRWSRAIQQEYERGNKGHCVGWWSSEIGADSNWERWWHYKKSHICLAILLILGMRYFGSKPSSPSFHELCWASVRQPWARTWLLCCLVLIVTVAFYLFMKIVAIRVS